MPYQPNCFTDSRVYVNGQRIPVSDIDIFMRKEGSLDFTRYAEGTFAADWQGNDYLDIFSGTDPQEQSEFDTVRIDVLDYATGSYTLAFQGVVTGVGNAPNGNERIWQFRAQGPSHLLSSVPANKTFRSATALDVVQYVVTEFRSRLPFDLSLQVSDSASGGGQDPDTQVQEGGTWPEEFTIGGVVDGYTSAIGDVQTLATGEVPDVDIDLAEAAAQTATGPFLPSLAIAGSVAPNVTDTIHTPRTFQSHKHTLADVMNWVSSKTETFAWLSPAQDGVTLTMTTQPTDAHHDAHYEDGHLHVVNNDALSELKPVNTLVAKGEAAKSIANVGAFELNSPRDKYNVAEVLHRPLYQRAGGVKLHADTDQVLDAYTKSEVEHEAKKTLKQAIGGTTDGTLQTFLRGPITPFDTLTARPTCGSRVATNASSLTYEVSRVHHKIRGKGTSQTELHVGLHTSLDEIEILDSWEEEQ